MPRLTFSAVGSTSTMLPRTLVPSQSTTAATNGTGTPGAAIETIVNALTMPLVSIGTCFHWSFSQLAQALRRSKKRAPHCVHSWATRCGSGSNARYSTSGTRFPIGHPPNDRSVDGRTLAPRPAMHDLVERATGSTRRPTGLVGRGVAQRDRAERTTPGRHPERSEHPLLDLEDPEEQRAQP